VFDAIEVKKRGKIHAITSQIPSAQKSEINKTCTSSAVCFRSLTPAGRSEHGDAAALDDLHPAVHEENERELNDSSVGDMRSKDSALTSSCPGQTRTPALFVVILMVVTGKVAKD
jgi:hypothetical protein